LEFCSGPDEKGEAMKITPLDVGSHKFPRKWKGYDPEQVDIFLEMVSQEMEDIIKENQFLSEELKRKSAALSEYKEKEQILKDTMITAQRTSEDMKNNMIKEAQAILAQAELEAEAIIRKAHERVIEIHGEIQDMKEQRIRVQEELRKMLRTHLALIEAQEEKAREDRERIEDNLRLMPARKRKSGN